MRFAAIVASAAAVLTLVGCAGSPGAPSNSSAPADSVGYFRVADVNVHGRSIPCVTWKYVNVGGLSCDWSQAR
jgi:hypothetical protein